jgi:hypothetical protein
MSLGKRLQRKSSAQGAITAPEVAGLPEAIAAAKWWGEQLRNGKGGHEPTEMQVAVFEAALAGSLTDERAQQPHGAITILNGFTTLDSFLARAARAAGIDVTKIEFPWGSFTVTENGRVWAKISRDDDAQEIPLPRERSEHPV